MQALINGRVQTVNVITTTGDLVKVKDDRGNVHTISHKENAVFNQSIRTEALGKNRLN